MASVAPTLLLKGGAIPLGCALGAAVGDPRERHLRRPHFGSGHASSSARTSGWSASAARPVGSTAASASFVPAATETFAFNRSSAMLSLVWQPQFTWSLGAILVVGSVEGGQRTQAGLSQAYLTYRPMRGSNDRIFARAPASCGRRSASSTRVPTGMSRIQSRPRQSTAGSARKSGPQPPKRPSSPAFGESISCGADGGADGRPTIQPEHVAGRFCGWALSRPAI